MPHEITYGQLYDRLDELGFARAMSEYKNQSVWLFKHRTHDRAMIVLPQRDREELVEPLYQGSVIATLQSHGLVPEPNPLGI